METMDADVIALRSSVRHLAGSRVVLTGVALLLLLTPVALGMWRAAGSVEGLLSEVFRVAALVPAAGIVFTVVMLIRALWVRTRPVLRIGTHVSLPRSGVRFPVEQLDTLQLYRQGDRIRLVLLPAHVSERYPQDPLAVDPYTVTFPDGATPMPYELVELVRRRVPGVGVEKLG